MNFRIICMGLAMVFAGKDAVADISGSPACGIGGEVILSGDAARASDSRGAIRVRGSGLAIRLAAEWRWRGMCVGGALYTSATSGLVRTGDGLKAPLDDAALLQIGAAVGASYEWARRWWVRGDLGPTWLVYVSPRVVSFATGVNFSVEIARDLAQVGHWVFGVAGRVNTAVVPDGDQTWLLANIGLSGAVRRNW